MTGEGGPGCGALPAGGRAGRLARAASARDAPRQRGAAGTEVGIQAPRFAGKLDAREAFQDLLPEDLQLQLGQAIAHAAMDAEAEGDVLARPGTVDDELVGPLDRRLVAVGRQVPHHHLVTAPDGLAAELEVGQRGAAHVRHRRLPAHDLGHQAAHQRRVGAQLVPLAGVGEHGMQTARHGVARGVVAAHDQQHHIAQELHRCQGARGRAVGEHGHQVSSRRLSLALLPEPLEVLEALHQLGQALLLGVDAQARLQVGGGHIGPPGEQAPVLEGEVEQGGQHAGGELDGHPLHPVEGLVAREIVEHAAGALADERLHLREIARPHDRADGLALLVVPGRVRRDERGPPIALGLVADGDAAVLDARGEHRVVHLDLHHILVAGHRPVGPESALRAPVHGIFAAQPRKERPYRVVLEEGGVADIDRVHPARRARQGGGGGAHLGPPSQRTAGTALCGTPTVRAQATIDCQVSSGSGQPSRWRCAR